MQAREIQLIDKPIRISFDGSKISLPGDLQAKVDAHWQKLVSANPRLHNGEVFTVVSIDASGDAIAVRLSETNYAHYLYSQQVGGLGAYMVRVIHPSALVVTQDNTFIVGEMGGHTSRPGTIQCCGGGIDHKSIHHGKVDIAGCLAIELGEELGIDVTDTSRIAALNPRYLISGGKHNTITIAHVLELRQSSEAFLEDYAAFCARLIEQGEEPEFAKLYAVESTTKAVETFIAAHSRQPLTYVPTLLRTLTN